jgi:hypothetical protein
MRTRCPLLEPSRHAPSCLDEIRSRKDEFKRVGKEWHCFKEMIAVVDLRWISVDVMIPTINGFVQHQKQIWEPTVARFRRYDLAAMPRLVL